MIMSQLVLPVYSFHFVGLVAAARNSIVRFVLGHRNNEVRETSLDIQAFNEGFFITVVAFSADS
jgi:hypothetical protein